MAKQLYANNAFGTLASSIGTGDLSATLTAGHGARFPNPTGGDYFLLTFIDSSNQLEIVKVTARATDVITMVRAQEGTTAKAFAASARVELRPTRDTLANIAYGDGVQTQAYNYGVAGGTVDAITVTLTPVPTLADGLFIDLKALGANASGTPTLNPNSLGAKTIVKGNRVPLAAADIPAANYPARFRYVLAWDQFQILNPRSGVHRPGQIEMLGGALPFDALDCDGVAVSRTTYADLFAYVGTAYGVGDGSTTFNKPDFRDRVPIGVSPGGLGADRPTARSVGQVGGEEKHFLTAAESGVGPHAHTFPVVSFDTPFGTAAAVGVPSSNANPATSTVSADASQAHNIIQPFGVARYVIYF